MVKLDNTQATAVPAQAAPKPVPPKAAPRPQAKPQAQPISKPKFKPRVVKTQPEPKNSDVVVTILKAERERRLQVAKYEADQQEMRKQHDSFTKKILEQAVEKMKKLAEYISDNTHLIARDYEVHEATNRVTVKIYDSVTGEVIREVPGNDFLDRVHKMEQLMGLMFDKLV